MENKFRKVCNSISYNTYGNLEKLMAINTTGVPFIYDFLPSQHIGNFKNTYIISSLIAYLILKYSNGKQHTKEITEIREMYQEFISNYDKMNEIFNLNNPLQIYTMFYCILKSGYLSEKHNHPYISAYDDIGIDGINVIIGTSECRHISAMLCDILNTSQIEAYRLGVYINDKNITGKIRGNHSISVAIKDNICYYLDITNFLLFRTSEFSKNILYDNNKYYAQITPLTTLNLNGIKDYLKLRRLLDKKYPSIRIEESEKIIEEIINTYKNNLDIFEHFYQENKDLYAEISNKVLKLKNKV